MSFIWLYLKISISDFRLILLDHTTNVAVPKITIKDEAFKDDGILHLQVGRSRIGI